MTKKEREEQIKFMGNSDRWPLHPILPLKNRKGIKTYGFLNINKTHGFMHEAYPREVFFGNMYDKILLNNRESTTYKTLHDLIKAGWEID